MYITKFKPKLPAASKKVMNNQLKNLKTKSNKLTLSRVSVGGLPAEGDHETLANFITFYNSQCKQDYNYNIQTKHIVNPFDANRSSVGNTKTIDSSKINDKLITKDQNRERAYFQSRQSFTKVDILLRNPNIRANLQAESHIRSISHLRKILRMYSTTKLSFIMLTT